MRPCYVMWDVWLKSLMLTSWGWNRSSVILSNEADARSFKSVFATFLLSVDCGWNVSWPVSCPVFPSCVRWVLCLCSVEHFFDWRGLSLCPGIHYQWSWLRVLSLSLFSCELRIFKGRAFDEWSFWLQHWCCLLHLVHFQFKIKSQDL